MIDGHRERNNRIITYILLVQKQNWRKENKPKICALPLLASASRCDMTLHVEQTKLSSTLGSITLCEKHLIVPFVLPETEYQVRPRVTEMTWTRKSLSTGVLYPVRQLVLI
ncbi:hypothetical protein CBL_14343 [Carabus blaptoides fortunei]